MSTDKHALCHDPQGYVPYSHISLFLTSSLPHLSSRNVVSECLSNGGSRIVPRAAATTGVEFAMHNIKSGRKLVTLKLCRISKGVSWSTSFVRKVMRLIRENSFNWRYVYTHLIFFKITSLSINTPLPAVLPRVVARLEFLNWDLFQSIRHGSLHVFNSPKMVSFQAGFEPGKQKEIGRDSPWEMFRTNVVQEIKTHILSSRTLFYKLVPFMRYGNLTYNQQDATYNDIYY